MEKRRSSVRTGGLAGHEITEEGERTLNPLNPGAWGPVDGDRSRARSGSVGAFFSVELRGRRERRGEGLLSPVWSN